VGSLVWTYTVTGSEPIGTVFFTGSIPPFTGAWSMGMHLSIPAPGTHLFDFGMGVTTPAAGCHGWMSSFTAGQQDTGVTGTVGVPSFDWSCFNWDYWNTRYSPGSPRLVTGTVITWTWTADALTPLTGFCQYGTEQKEPLSSIINLSPAVAAALLPIEGLWAVPLILAASAPVVALNVLCSGNPFPPQVIAESDWTTFDNTLHLPKAYGKVVANFQNTLWHHFCQCEPGPSGSPTPTPPNVVNWNAPTYLVQINNNTVSNYDIAYTLNQIINTYSPVTFYQNYYNYQVGIAEAGCTPAEYVESTVHEDLLGTGRFEIGDVVGFKVEALERNISEPVLEGQPMYLWNMGWISVLADELLLDEKRVTRSGYLWFPCSLKHATSFTYTLRDFTRLRVTELVKPSAPALPGP